MSYRCKSVVSLLGGIRLDRAYYHCTHCRQGHVPWDETLRLSPQRLTPGAEEVTALTSEGRMVAVGMVYNPQPRAPDDEALARPCDGVRYLAGLYTLDELGLQLRRQAAHVRNGWHIATGAIESACKTVINQRLCMGGMRWGEEGSDGVAHLRALYRSDPDQWECFWGQAA